MDRDGREIHGQAAGQHHAALDRLDQLGGVTVAGVVRAAGVGDADDRARQRRISKTCAFDKGFAQEQREPGVTIVGEPLGHARRAAVRHGAVGFWFGHDSG